MIISRYLQTAIQSDSLKKGKIALISGPRQVGKSTLAKAMLQSKENYFLYDEEEFRRAWAKSPSQALALRGAGPVILDEIHKDRKWKSKVKGIYDKSSSSFPIIITGSARMDHYRKGSDSLLGRYIPYRLAPFTVGENQNTPSPDNVLQDKKVNFLWGDLQSLGGFPEPLLSGNEMEAKRWSRLRLDRLILEDSRDILNISDLNAFRTLIELLPERVGSLLSVNALHEDVGKAYATVRSWINVLDALYYTFTIKPYSRKVARTLKAEPKLYLYDILRIPPNESAKRLENLAALHLLKACNYWTDTAQGEFELHFLRTKEKREVDFAIIRDGKVWMLVECKSGLKEPSKNLIYFSSLLKPKFSVQLVNESGYDRYFAATNIRVLDYESFFAGMV